ncbi:MAG: hypothetical protein AAF530_16585 [Pseudomonadota bacterium]
MTTSPIQNREDFAQVYNLSDPRPYFRGVSSVDYQMPAVACDFLLKMAGHLRTAKGKEVLTVLDFAGGYGINGALLTHHISLAEFFAWYDSTPADDSDVQAADRAYFSARRRERPDLEVLGLDIAECAMAYAARLKFYGNTFVENLVEQPPSPRLTAAMERVDVIMETGALGLTLPMALQRLIEVSGNAAPWVLMTSRPDLDDGPLIKVLSQLDYVVETCTAEPVAYRKFASAGERAEVRAKTAALGGNPAVALKNDYFWVDLLLARPAHVATCWPLTPYGLRVKKPIA